MAPELIKVKKSGIHNKGVFAKRDIKKGTSIIRYKGRKITKKQSDETYEKSFERHKKNQKHGSVYIFELNKRYDIDGNIPGNPAKYINHSCDSNCEAVIYDGKEIWIEAIKDIKKDEELTYNYGYDINNYKDHPCRCGSKNCVGFIAAKSLWPRLKKKLEKERIKNSGKSE